VAHTWGGNEKQSWGRQRKTRPGNLDRMRAENKICRGWHLLPDRRRKAKPSTGGDKSWAAGSPLGRSRSSRRAFEQQIGHEIRAESSNQRRQLLGTESELKKKILLAA
jgi:hypothetical protein